MSKLFIYMLTNLFVYSYAMFCTQPIRMLQNRKYYVNVFVLYIHKYIIILSTSDNCSDNQINYFIIILTVTREGLENIIVNLISKSKLLFYQKSVSPNLGLPLPKILLIKSH